MGGASCIPGDYCKSKVMDHRPVPWRSEHSGARSERHEQSGVRLYQRCRGLVLSVIEFRHTTESIRVTDRCCLLLETVLKSLVTQLSPNESQTQLPKDPGAHKTYSKGPVRK